MRSATSEVEPDERPPDWGAHVYIYALSSSAAVLALSQYASAPLNAQMGQDGFSSAVGATWTLLTFYTIVAPVTATFAVLATRGMRWKVRVVVVLSSVFCAVSLAGSTLTDWIYTSPFGRLYLAFGMIAVPGVGALVVLIALTVGRRLQPLNTLASGGRITERMLHSTLAGSLVALAVAAGYVAATGLWETRVPLVFGNPVTDSNRASFEE